MTTAVLHNGLWKEPNVIFAKHNDVFKEVAASDLRLIGASSVAGGSLTPVFWEMAKEGDLVLVFAVRNSSNAAITPPSGFTQIRTAAGASTRLSAFYKFVGADAALGGISAVGAQRLSALVYRGASGVGVSAQNVTETVAATHSVSVTGVTAESLIAAAAAYNNIDKAGETTGFGWGMPGGRTANGSGFAGTTVGAAGATTVTPSFIMVGDGAVNVIGVEILAK